MKRILFAAVVAAAFHGLLLMQKIHRTSQTPPVVRQRTVQITLAAATPAPHAKKEKKKGKRFTAPDPVHTAEKTMPAKRAKRVDPNRKITRKRIIKRISRPISKTPVRKPFKAEVKKTALIKPQPPGLPVTDPEDDAEYSETSERSEPPIPAKPQPERTSRPVAQKMPGSVAESTDGVKPITKNAPPKQSTITEAVPAYRKNSPPRYPRMARRRGCEGTVLIKVLVTRNGKVKEAKMGQSSGYGVLDRSALNAVKGWLFVPGMRGDQTVEMWVTVPIRFALK
jgi:periplasmic protein TonB